MCSIMCTLDKITMIEDKDDVSVIRGGVVFHVHTCFSILQKITLYYLI